MIQRVENIDWHGRPALVWGPLVTAGTTYGLALAFSSSSGGDTSTAAIGEAFGAFIGGAIGLLAGAGAVSRATRGDLLPWLTGLWAAIAGLGIVATATALRDGGATPADVLAFGGLMFLPTLLVVWFVVVIRSRRSGFAEE